MYRSSLSKKESQNYATCPNVLQQQQAQQAYSNYLRTAVLNGDDDSCNPPCQFSIVQPKVFSEGSEMDVGGLKEALGFEVNKTMVLTMPAIIQLTESNFSYPLMSFAADFGGKSICVGLFKTNQTPSCRFLLIHEKLSNIQY